MATIDIEQQIEEVYRMAHDRFKDYETDRPPEQYDFDTLTNSMWWVNDIAPDLRERAGFADTGFENYGEERDVAIVTYHSHLDDRQMEVDVVSSLWVYRKLEEAYRMGVYDGIGDTYDVDAVLEELV